MPGRHQMVVQGAGDAYLFLHSAEATPGGSLQHEIHFWLGKESRQDEGAAAAMLAVQLDSALGAEGADASITRCSDSLIPSLSLLSSNVPQRMPTTHTACARIGCPVRP
jgi:Gelsolin repeat